MRKWRSRMTFFLTVLLATPVAAEWKIDMSRRQKELNPAKVQPAVVQEKPSLLESVVGPMEPQQDVVILNTDKGFVPSTLTFRIGRLYQVHVVNVAEKMKNVSFVLDAFEQHHATYFGVVKSFSVKPTAAGIFTYQCPETTAQGRLTVLGDSDAPQVPVRAPASGQKP